MFTETEKEQIIKAFNELSKDEKIEFFNAINDKIVHMIETVDDMKI